MNEYLTICTDNNNSKIILVNISEVPVSSKIQAQRFVILTMKAKKHFSWHFSERVYRREKCTAFSASWIPHNTIIYVFTLPFYITRLIIIIIIIKALI